MKTIVSKIKGALKIKGFSSILKLTILGTFGVKSRPTDPI